MRDKRMVSRVQKIRSGGYDGGVRGGWYVGLPPCILHGGRDVCGDGLWPPDRKVRVV